MHCACGDSRIAYTDVYTRPRCTADGCRPSCTILELPRHTRRRPHYQLPHGVPQKSPYTHAHARQIIMNRRLGQSFSSWTEARGIDMTSRAGSAISSPLFPTRVVMPFSQSIVVMIGSVSILRLQVTLTRALMHSVIHTAFPCDCISSWKWIEMETDPI